MLQPTNHVEHNSQRGWIISGSSVPSPGIRPGIRFFTIDPTISAGIFGKFHSKNPRWQVNFSWFHWVNIWFWYVFPCFLGHQTSARWKKERSPDQLGLGTPLRLRFLGNLKLNLWDCGGTVSACDVFEGAHGIDGIFLAGIFLEIPWVSSIFLEAKISSWRTISNLSVRTSSSTARQSWMMWVVTPNSTRLSRCEFFLIEATTQSGLFIFGWCEKPYGGSQLIASVKTRSHDIPPIGHIGPHP